MWIVDENNEEWSELMAEKMKKWEKDKMRRKRVASMQTRQKLRTIKNNEGQ